MLHIQKLEDGLEIYKALGSELRLKLVRLLLNHQDMNLNELAAALGVSNGALTPHIKKLEESGVIRVLAEHSGHGNQKICRVNLDKILIDIQPELPAEAANVYTAELPIGHYADYQVFPTCGIATDSRVIGEVDDPRYFAHPERVNARILWFTRGYIEYNIPNLLPKNTRVRQLSLSVELGSEAPGVNNDWPSDISFYLNGKKIGEWTSPGDFGDVHGIFTPEWWFPNWNQYGLLKVITINAQGTFIDGLQISGVTVDEFALDFRSMLKFRFQVADDARNVGGLTLFGRDFGNYNQDIKLRISYGP